MTQSLETAALGLLLLLASVIDLRSDRLPDRITLGLVVAGLIATRTDAGGIMLHLLGFLAFRQSF
ncbi:prepilin peptidase [Devosia sp.]|uniref:prepilin peptidase n=1 Tax=Devosia sp. TaxID=1871048 RepID=UPI0034401A41